MVRQAMLKATLQGKEHLLSLGIYYLFLFDGKEDTLNTGIDMVTPCLALKTMKCLL